MFHHFTSTYEYGFRLSETRVTMRNHYLIKTEYKTSYLPYNGFKIKPSVPHYSIKVSNHATTLVLGLGSSPISHNSSYCNLLRSDTKIDKHDLTTLRI